MQTTMCLYSLKKIIYEDMAATTEHKEIEMRKRTYLKRKSESENNHLS